MTASTNALHPTLPKGPPAPNATASAKQLARRAFKPLLPSVFSSTAIEASPVSPDSLLNAQDMEMNAPFSVSPEDAKILRSLFPNTIDTPFLKLVPSSNSSNSTSPLKVGVVLSGGQAAGGHNVICGVYDYIQKVNPSSVLYGFIGGPHGVYSGEYVVLNKEIIDEYRNMGGFDMIKSGRHKIETEEQKQASLEVCKKLQLNGLVVIGGDDSNTNAAILAEYFKERGSTTQVVGCPKTIDGDLKNYFVEISFGFDTACRTYSCSIGNLMAQTLTQRDVYQFIRLMGRSASLLTLECALRCRPNMTFIGEEVLAKKQSLKHLVCMTADLVEARAKLGKLYGVILLPEGLIEFIPEVGELIREINTIVAAGDFDKNKLSPTCKEILEMLPHQTQQQLLLDRDPHGNVQVALIHTEKLLLELTAEELKRRNFHHPFNGRCSYLGYEGRSGFPSDFDATYCYGLGNVAGALIQNKGTSCMAVLKGMSCSHDVREWQPAGIPLTRMMNLENRKGKANVPVIKKFLVDIDKPLFKAFEAVRDAWKLLDVYAIVGPMQLDEQQPQLPYTLTGPPAIDVLLPPAAAAAYKEQQQQQQQQLKEGYRLYFELLPHLRTPLQQLRSSATAEAPQQLLQQQATTLSPAEEVLLLQQQQQQLVKQLFPKTAAIHGNSYNVINATKSEQVKVGIVLIGEATPGLSNVALGIVQKVIAAGGQVFGVLGGEQHFEEITNFKNIFEMEKNLNAFPFLGRTAQDEQQLLAPGGPLAAACSLDVLVVLRGSLIGSAVLAEQLQQRGDKTKVINVCGDADFCMIDPSPCLTALQQQQQQQQQQDVICFSRKEKNLLCKKAEKIISDASGASALGFDSQTKAAAELVSNLMTDSKSASKYFYFCKIGGGRGAEGEITIQTHPNVCLLSSACAELTPVQIVQQIANAVAARCAEKKNFGVLILNEDFFITNKALRSVAITLSCNKGDVSSLKGNDAAVFASLPVSFQHQFVECFSAVTSLPQKAAAFPILECFAAMVSQELKKRKAEGTFNGSFSPICFDLTAQIRGTFPSAYDCSLGYTLGLLCGSLSISLPLLRNLPSAVVFISNPTASPSSFSPFVVPLSVAALGCGLVAVKPSTATTAAAGGVVDAAAAAAGGAFDLQQDTPSAATAAAAVNPAVQQKEFLQKDFYLNSGPIQFFNLDKGEADADKECNYMLSALES